MKADLREPLLLAANLQGGEAVEIQSDVKNKELGKDSRDEEGFKRPRWLGYVYQLAVTI